MTLSGLVDLVAADPTIAPSVDDARRGLLRALDLTAPEALRPVLVAALAAGSGRPALLITSTYREAEATTAALASLLGDERVAYYPAWETLPHERLSPRSDTVGRRLQVLRRLAVFRGPFSLSTAYGMHRQFEKTGDMRGINWADYR